MWKTQPEGGAEALGISPSSLILGRSAPWVLLVPFTLREGLSGLVDGEPGRATTFLWLWLLGTLGIFSLTPSRLEHYALPALPAVAPDPARAPDQLSAWWLLTLAARLVREVGGTVSVGIAEPTGTVIRVTIPTTSEEALADVA